MNKLKLQKILNSFFQFILNTAFIKTQTKGIIWRPIYQVDVDTPCLKVTQYGQSIPPDVMAQLIDEAKIQDLDISLVHQELTFFPKEDKS